MITLRKKPYVDTLSVTDMMTFDTKANIIEHYKIANIDIPQRWRKAEIGEALREIFFQNSRRTIVRLDAIYIERVIFALKSSKGLVNSRKKHIFVPSYI